MFLLGGGGYDVPSCLVPCSFWGCLPGGMAFWLKVAFCYGLLVESDLLLWPWCVHTHTHWHLVTATKVVGTNSTGIHSCFVIFYYMYKKWKPWMEIVDAFGLNYLRSSSNHPVISDSRYWSCWLDGLRFTHVTLHSPGQPGKTRATIYHLYRFGRGKVSRLLLMAVRPAVANSLCPWILEGFEDLSVVRCCLIDVWDYPTLQILHKRLYCIS